MKTALIRDTATFEGTPYTSKHLETLSTQTELLDQHINSENFEAMASKLSEVEALFSSYPMVSLTSAQLDAMPNLKAVFYAGGSVSSFAGPMIERGIHVFSARNGNATPVAQYSFACALLGLKAFWYSQREYTAGNHEGVYYNKAGAGIYNEKVAVIGQGAIGQQLCDLLDTMNLEVIKVPSRKTRRTISIEAAFDQAFVVINLLPDRDDNRGDLRKEHFLSMRKGATFINVGRGAQVDEEGLIEALQERTDLTAVLDVTAPEPCEMGSALRTLPNCVLTPHMAGSIGKESQRLSEMMLQAFELWRQGELDENCLIGAEEFSAMA
jgi:phosphoglycerate dehydrogenase-like enzyme